MDLLIYGCCTGIWVCCVGVGVTALVLELCVVDVAEG